MRETPNTHSSRTPPDFHLGSECSKSQSPVPQIEESRLQVGAEFWEGDATKQKSVKESAFHWKGRRSENETSVSKILQEMPFTEEVRFIQ